MVTRPFVLLYRTMKAGKWSLLNLSKLVSRTDMILILIPSNFRPGNKKDRETVLDMAKQLGMDVEEIRNKSSDDVVKQLNRILLEAFPSDETKYTHLLLVIMGHGGKEKKKLTVPIWIIKKPIFPTFISCRKDKESRVPSMPIQGC